MQDVRLAVVMSVCGHKKYFEYAALSIQSFILSNPDYDLFVFTDNRKYFKDRCTSDKVHFIDFQSALD